VIGSDLANTAALKSAFERNTLAALVAVSPKNVYYYSRSPMARVGLFDNLPHNPGSPSLTLALVTPDRRVLVVCPEDQELVHRNGTWADELELYQQHRESPMQALARAVQRVGVTGDRIGIEVEYFSADSLRQLKKLLPVAQLVPSDYDLEWVRSLKTPAEIKILKASADLLDDAFLEAFTSIRPGDTEWDFHSCVIESSMRLGAEYCRGFIAAGINNDISFFGTNHKRLEPGDIIHTDYATYLEGYPSNLTRLGVIGEPSNLQRKKYANLLAVENRIVEFMRPGVTGREVFRFARQACLELGYIHTAAILGHNLGLGYHDRPMLTDAETMPLEASNHIALEPLLEWTFHIQDQVLIEAGGARIISDKFDTSELFVVE
jgi:Xaa-Pro aminopeptidase